MADRGRTVGAERYRIGQRLGGGGMATVYLAFDQALERPVALKQLAAHLADDTAFRERFLREAQLAARLVHPNIVQVYDVGENEQGPFIVMEYVEGATLAQELRRRSRLPADEVQAVGRQLCAALEAAHGAGLVHRDVKPQNVLRDRCGRVKLADFGIARSLAATRQTEPGTLLGTAAYLAPEQARGEPVGPPADIYALGVVLYELLTGQTPHRAETLAELLAQREHAPVRPPGELVAGVPNGLDAALIRCLARQPAARPSAAALAADLEPEDAEPETLPLIPAAGAANRPLRPPAGAGPRARLVVSGAALALVASGLALALASTGGRHAHAASNLALPDTQPTTAVTATTTPTTTAAATIATATTASTPPTSTPTAPAATTSADAALAAARAAIAQAATSGQLDPGAANDLNHHLDDLAKTLAQGKPNDAARKLADLSHHLDDLARAGRLTATALNQIGQPLAQLAALLPALPGNSPAGENDQGGD